MTDTIISAQNLTKTFWRRNQRRGMIGAVRGLVDRGGTEVTAVSGVSFEIRRGEIIGYIGPNGAGKSTTIKMLTGILVPSSGTASVASLTPWEQRRQLAQQIGVVFGQRTQLWWDLPLVESLELLRFMYKVPAERFRRNLDDAIELLDMQPFMETPVRQLSMGQRMRGDLAAALLHEPPILYLDEPTIGLDLVAKLRIREYLAEINRSAGVTILLTTHDLADIERLCSRIIVIDHGQIVHDGQLASLRRRFGARRLLTIDFEHEPAAVTGLPHGVDIVDQEGARLTVSFDRTAYSAPDLVAQLGQIGSVLDIGIEEPAIENVIEQLYASSRTGSVLS